MPDHGARYTDEQIAELEARLTAMYETAYKDVREKYVAFVKRFLTKDKEYRQKLKDGEITKEAYDAWLRGQVFQKTRWEAQLDDLAQTLTHTTQTAMDIINDAAPGVFAMNANYAEYEIEKAGNIDMGFGLYDEDTVRRLVRDDPNLVPTSKVNTPLEQTWNRTLINRQIGVGIIAGEGILAIADRLQRAAIMSRNQALTHARTAMTSAQNAGRIEGYHRAEQMGIKLEKEWLATLDGHTRRSHAVLDGQHVPVDEPFQSILGEIMYPGDPSANPSNVYNCRCTLISRLIEYPSENAKRRPNLQKLCDEEVQKPIKDMTYAEWAGWKKAEKREKPKLVFVEAKNKNEAEEFAYNNFGVFANYSTYDISVANAINRTMLEAKEIFGVHAFDELNYIGTFPKGYSSNWKGAYVTSSDPTIDGSLWLRNVRNKNALEKLESVAKEQYEMGYWSTPHALQTIRHELGHAIHRAIGTEEKTAQIYEYMKSIKTERFIRNRKGDRSHKYSDWLSEYGFTNVKEFIAESVAEYMGGNPRQTAKKVVEMLIGGE